MLQEFWISLIFKYYCSHEIFKPVFVFFLPLFFQLIVDLNVEIHVAVEKLKQFFKRE